MADRDGEFDVRGVIARAFNAGIGNLIPFLLLSILLVGVPTFVTLYPPAWAAIGGVRLFGVWSRLAAPWLTLIPIALFNGVAIRVAFNDLTGRGSSFGIALMATAATSVSLILFSLLNIIATIVGALLLVIPGLIAMTRLSVGGAAIVIEGLGVFGGVRRSFELTRGLGWAVFGLFLISGLANYGVLYLARYALTGALGFRMDPALIGDLRYTLVQCADYTIFQIISAAGIASTYIELVRLQHGGDEQQVAEVFS